MSRRNSGCTQKYGPLSTPVTASHQGGVTGARTFYPFVELFEIQRDKGYNHDDWNSGGNHLAANIMKNVIILSGCATKHVMLAAIIVAQQIGFKSV